MKAAGIPRHRDIPKSCCAFLHATPSARFWSAGCCKSRFIGVLCRLSAWWIARLVSCFTVMSALAQTNPPVALAEVPLKTRSGELLVETRIKGSEPLVFKLDSRFGVTTIHPNRVESLNLE